ncbi:MAG TPA: putative lipid II flippase FtsW [Polyangiaceae bacterium]
MKSVQDLLASNRRRGPMDVVLAAAAIALLGFGVVMVYSASIIEATTVFRNPQYFLIRQSIYAGVGLTILLVASRIDVHKLKPFTYPILGLVTLLMVLSVVGFGKSGGGATRWLAVGPIHIQPSEMAKLALILWLAYSLEKKREKMKSFSIGMLPHFIMAGLLMLLCMKQPDFGSAVVLLFLTFALLFVAGARLGYLLGAALVGLMFAAWAVRFTNYRWVRLVAWSNMSEHRQDLAYQPFQSVMSFGSGEVTGLGLGKGLQVLYLPESHTDFISAIIGEELGFLGILGLVAVFLVIVARGVRTALSAEDEYQSYIAFGISVLFGAQTLVNLAVSMAMLPTKGLTLPFISYGGSSLLVSCAAMGILLSISRRTGERENVKVDAPTPPPPEVSAMLVTEAGFAPEPVSFRHMSPRGAP